jgi:acetyl esterase/lipase
MRGYLFLAVMAVGLVLGGALAAKEVPQLPRPETVSYGSDRLQALDFWRAQAPSAPLTVFVHGGAWRAGDKNVSSKTRQVPYFLSKGHAFASVNYRLVPDVGVAQQAEDVARSLKFLVDRAEALGFDRKRIILMGHSAGAHLAALVATDGRYLQQAGLQPEDIAGVLRLDGAGYDVPRQMAVAGSMMQRTYKMAFGEDPAQQRALSPIVHVGAPNARAFLVLHVQRPDAAEQSRALVDALRQAGTRAEVHGLPGEGRSCHREIIVELGDPSYAGTAIVDRWLGGVL